MERFLHFQNADSLDAAWLTGDLQWSAELQPGVKHAVAAHRNAVAKYGFSTMHIVWLQLIQLSSWGSMFFNSFEKP